MTKLEELNRGMLGLEKAGYLTEDEYTTSKRLLEAVESAQNLVAMKGRYNTVIAYGRLEQTLEKLK